MANAALTATANVGNVNDFATALNTDGTSVWGFASNGDVFKYTMATGAAVAGQSLKLSERITAVVVYTTHLLVATDKGNIYAFTLSTLVNESATNAPILSLGSAITAMTISGTAVIIATADGKGTQYTISG